MSSPSESSATGTELLAAVTAEVEQHFDDWITTLSDLVGIPSVSWDTFDLSRVNDSAEAVRSLFASTGLFDSIRIVQEDVGDYNGRPAVLARREAKNGRPTILLYAHHDVQPPGDDELWDSPPFEPTRRGDRLFGRGAADDKAGVMLHLASLQVLAKTLGDSFDLGIALFIEGEEEFGSGSFTAILERHADTLAADALIVADSSNWDETTPALTVGLRGNVTFPLTVRTLEHALHSGMHGGAVPDAFMAATRLVNTLWTDDGSVAVAGLLETDFDYPDYDEARLRAESHLLPTSEAIGSGHILSRTWAKPAITVTGIDAPSVAQASNTLLPSVTLRLSVRLAPGQDPHEAFAAVEKHLHEHTPFGATVTLGSADFGSGFTAATDRWATPLMLTAMERGWGKAPLSIGVGGSIPFITDLVRTFPDAQVLVTGVEDADSRAHSPNESLLLSAYRKAVIAQTLFLISADERQG